MIKIQNNTATREPIPKFLRGLKPESLADLSWTDPALGVQDCAWWPEVDESPELQEYQSYGEEILTIDEDNKRVIVTRSIIPWTQEEIDAHLEAEFKALVPESVTKRQGRQQMILMDIIDQVQTAIDAISDPVQKALVQSFWDDSTEYERDHPQMTQLAQAIGFTDEQLDDTFIEAAKL